MFVFRLKIYLDFTLYFFQVYFKQTTKKNVNLTHFIAQTLGLVNFWVKLNTSKAYQLSLNIRHLKYNNFKFNSRYIVFYKFVRKVLNHYVNVIN